MIIVHDKLHRQIYVMRRHFSNITTTSLRPHHHKGHVVIQYRAFCPLFAFCLYRLLCKASAARSSNDAACKEGKKERYFHETLGKRFENEGGKAGIIPQKWVNQRAGKFCNFTSEYVLVCNVPILQTNENGISNGKASIRKRNPHPRSLQAMERRRDD
jgi:hypothetical protein